MEEDIITGQAFPCFFSVSRLVFRAVHPGQVEHEVRLPAIVVQQGGIRVHVILEQLQFRSGKRKVLQFAVPDVAQLGYKVPADEPASAGH